MGHLITPPPVLQPAETASNPVKHKSWLKIVAVLSIIVVFIALAGVLFVLFWVKYEDQNPNSLVNQSLAHQAQDTQRKNSIQQLAGAMAEYRSKIGYYPTNEMLNSAAFRSSYSLTSDITTDPAGTNSVIGVKPGKGSYSYFPTGDADSACDNTTISCLRFTLTAILNNGTRYTLTERD